MSAATVKAAIDAGLKAWSKYDKDEVSKDLCGSVPDVARRFCSLLNVQCITCHPGSGCAGCGLGEGLLFWVG